MEAGKKINNTLEIVKWLAAYSGKLLDYYVYSFREKEIFEDSV